MCIEMAPFRREEPEPIEHEASEVLAKMFETLHAEGLTKAQIARELCLSRADLEALTFGLDLADGGAEVG